MWKWCSLEEFRIHASVLVEVSDAVLKSSEFMLLCYVDVSDAVFSSEFMLVGYVDVSDAVFSSEFMLVCYVDVDNAVLKSSEFMLMWM